VGRFSFSAALKNPLVAFRLQDHRPFSRQDAKNAKESVVLLFRPMMERGIPWLLDDDLVVDKEEDPKVAF